MAFMDKLGQIANKVGDVAGDTFDYGKAKGKIVLEKGKIKDIKEAIAIIRECAKKLEDYGFNVEVDELDFPESYQVNFRINK